MKNNSKYAQEFLRKGKLESIPIIDVHTHMGSVYGTSLSISNCEEMIKVMDRENIELIFCSPHSALFDPTCFNAEIEEAMERYPGRIMGYFCFNPNYADEMLPDIEKVIHIKGYIGYKFLPEYHRYALDGPEYKRVLEISDYYNLVVLSHTWGNSQYNSPKQVWNVVKKYRNIIFIMGHSAPGECEKAIEIAADYENVYLDLCDIHRHNGIVEKMVKKAGAEKVLLGSDMPWYDPNYCLGSVLFSRIPDEDKYRIIYGNAKQIAERFN